MTKITCHNCIVKIGLVDMEKQMNPRLRTNICSGSFDTPIASIVFSTHEKRLVLLRE